MKDYRHKKRKKISVTSYIIYMITFIILTVAFSSIGDNNTKEENKHDEASEEKEYITVLVESKPLGPDTFKNIQLDMDVLLQQPKLPSGCEPTSLTACLNYLGFNVDKVDIARLMPQGPINKTDPDVAFVGDPEIRGSYGCNAPVVVKTANKWLKNNADTDMKAYNLTGHEFDSLLYYIEKGYPVIIWGMEYMNPSSNYTTWKADGKEIVWHYGFHCLVLIGWNEDGYVIMDPILGMKTYSRENVHQCYEKLGKQAVVIIQPNNFEKK